jgi:hypothetical protein
MTNREVLHAFYEKALTIIDEKIVEVYHLEDWGTAMIQLKY